MTKTPSTKAVVDASYVLSLLLPDETAHHQVPSRMIAPTLLRHEVLSGLRSAVLQKRITQTLAHSLFIEFTHLPINYKEINFTETLNISVTHKISSYDASYLWLSRALTLPLKTFDRKLSDLADKAGA